MNLEEVSPATPAGAMPASVPVSPRYGTLSVFELQKTPAVWTESLAKDKLECRRIAEQEAPALQALMNLAGVYEPDDAILRLAAGRTAYVGEINKPDGSGLQMVTYGWVSTQTEILGQSGVAFQTPPGDVWLYDFGTDPAFRGRGFYPTLLRFILRELARQKVVRAWIGTEPGNYVSERSIARAGFTKVADTRYIKAQDGQGPRFEMLAAPGADTALVEAGQRAHVPV